MSCQEDEFLERALAAEDTLQAILNLHDEGLGIAAAFVDELLPPMCKECQRDHPCPTRRLIEGEKHA